MKFAFWISVAVILYTYAGYPVAVWLLARVCPRPWRREPISPSVSIVLAVRNCIERLPEKLRHLLDLDYSNVREIIVVSDGSTDGTADLLGRIVDPRIRTIVRGKHEGKAAAVNAGVAAATAEIVLFVDIRPQIAAGAIQALVDNFADPAVGCVAGELVLKQKGHDGATAAVGGLYWRYEQWIRICEAAFDSPVGVYGGFYAVRRKAFVPMPTGIILDDMFEPLSIIRQGYRSILETRACVYDMWPGKVEDEFQRKVRTLAGNFQLFQLAPWTLSFANRTVVQLVSHKVMRLIVPYFLVLLFVSSCILSAQSAPFVYVAALQAVGWLAAVLSLRWTIPLVHRIAAPLGALLVLNAAAVAGFYKFLFTREPLWKIWKIQSAGAGIMGNVIAGQTLRPSTEASKYGKGPLAPSEKRSVVLE